MPVTVEPVSLGTIESVIATTGTLRALGSADLLVEVRGELHYAIGASARKPAAGTWVEAGQLIARIDSEEHRNSIRMPSRELAHQNAQNRLTERKALFDEGLELASEVQAAQKAVADAEADLADGELQLDKLNVYAPISGFLAELADTTESTLVEQGAVIGKVVDYNAVLVDLLIPNSQIAAIARGQTVRVSNYAMRDRVFAGRVSGLDPTLDPTTRTFRVEVAVENPDRALRPGMFVRAEVVVERRTDVVTIPKELVLTRQNRRVVFVEEEGAGAAASDPDRARGRPPDRDHRRPGGRRPPDHQQLRDPALTHPGSGHRTERPHGLKLTPPHRRCDVAPPAFRFATR